MHKQGTILAHAPERMDSVERDDITAHRSRDTRSARREAVIRWPLPLSSTHASTGALEGTSLVVCGAEIRATFAVGGQAPEGMTLLGAIFSIAEKLSKVKCF
jgi:hypothetical protein